MDYTTPGITKEERVWLNACIALDITKEGLSSFVDNEITRFHVAVGTGCGNCFTENLIACPTDGMCEYANSCTYHKTPALQPLKCEKCEFVKQNIVSNHRYRHPSWKNTNAQQWANNHWEIAKCYINPSDGYLHVSSVQETDLTGIISLLLNCLHFNNCFSFEIASQAPRNECVLTRVCELIDKVHTAGCEISEDSLQDMFHTLSTILCDPVRLKYDSNACRANTKLEQLKTGHMAIPPNYYVQYMEAKHVIEQETLQQVSEVVQKTLQRNPKYERRVAEDKIPYVFHQIIRLISIGTQKIQGLNKFRFENNVSYESDGILSVNIKRQRTEVDLNDVNSPAQLSSHIVIYQPISHLGDICTSEMQKTGRPMQTTINSEKSEHVANSNFVRARIGMETLRITKSTLETIKGILTLCFEDFSHTPTVLNEKLQNMIDSTSVQVLTTKELCQSLMDVDSKDELHLSSEELFNTIQNAIDFILFVIDDPLQNTVNELLKRIEVSIPLGVLLVTNDTNSEIEAMQNVFFSRIESENVQLKHVDFLVNRCAHGILSTMYSKLAEDFTDADKESALNVRDLIMSSFQRNRISKAEWPNVPEEPFHYPQTIDKAVKSIVCEKGIIGCFKKRGSLHIYVDASMSQTDIESKILDKMNKHGGVGCKLVFEYGKITHFCSSGDIAGEGTLGGFVRSETKGSADMNEHLVALISSHVANIPGTEYLNVGRNRIRLGPIRGMHFSETIDIYPVKVDDLKMCGCNTRFRTEYGEELYAKSDIEISRGAIVHIWGRSIRPGLGILEGDIERENGKLVVIRNRYPDREFAMPGDSGAMVCYYDAIEQILYAVAMLMGPYTGENTHIRYVAQILHDGLRVLSSLNHCSLTLCDDSQ